MPTPDSEDKATNSGCAICGRRGVSLTKHHLIPRTTHKRKRIRKQFQPEVLQATVALCRSCHSQIHATFSPMELAESYNSITALLAHPGVSRYAAWARRQRGKIRVRGKR